MFRFQRYQILADRRDAIFQAFREIADSLDVGGYREDGLGMLGGSGGPPLLGESVRAAIEEGSRKLMPLSTLDDRIRILVKEVYGDDWDGAAVSTAEGGLWVVFESLVKPPMLLRGDKYQASFVTPLERHTHHQAAYGAPFPPWLRDHMADRGVTSGELGVQAKRCENVRAVFVPLAGARYDCHGIKYHPAFLLLNTDGAASGVKIRAVAQRHADSLSAVVSMGYDSSGYGYGDKGPNGAPVLQAALGDLAADYDVPYIVDNARGTPFLGLDPRQVGASIIVYSTDKAFGGPTGGLIIGREKHMVPVRRALGVHGNRWGTTSSHGKAGYVMVDPGKEALLGIVAALENLLYRPETLTDPVESLYGLTNTIAVEELGDLAEYLTINRSSNQLAVEVNYEGTWESDLPVPIFPIEDFYSGANLLQYGMKAAGVSPPLCYDGNMVIGPLSNLCDEEGVLNEDRAEFALRTLFRGIKHLTEQFN
jgi:hypothetical protein